ncbi:MAG: amidohydrolase family protein [Candidatus Marinimicrobia bacterium]|nr:amidohydrolase family protein [Candidatus Neomarinimicrobiota bacterium]
MQNLMDNIQRNKPDTQKPKPVDSLIIYGGPVYDGLGTVYEKGAVFIENNTISLIGEEEDVFGELQKGMQNVEILNTQGQLVAPGLINAHHHLHMAFSTGLTALGPTASFGERLENFIWPYEKALTKEAVQLSTFLTLLDSIKHGTTTIFAHHSSPNYITGSFDIIAGAFKRAGMRGLLSYSITDKFGENKFQSALEETKSFISEHRMTSLIKGIPGLHANLSLSEEGLKKYSETFDSSKGIHLHLGEAQEDLQFCIDKGYQGCLDRLDQFGLINEKSLLAHANHISEKDRALIKEKNPALIHNPISNANSKAGWFDLKLAQEALTGFGTDGISSNPVKDLNTASLLHNMNSDNNINIADNLIKMLFKNNSIIAGRHFDQNFGTLTQGSRADVVIFDYEPNTLIHSNNINKHLINGLKDSRAETVIVDGKIIYKDKAYLTIDKEIVTKEAKSLCQNIWENYVNQAGNSSNSPKA